MTMARFAGSGTPANAAAISEPKFADAPSGSPVPRALIVPPLSVTGMVTLDVPPS